MQVLYTIIYGTWDMELSVLKIPESVFHNSLRHFQEQHSLNRMEAPRCKFARDKVVE